MPEKIGRLLYVVEARFNSSPFIVSTSWERAWLLPLAEAVALAPDSTSVCTWFRFVITEPRAVLAVPSQDWPSEMLDVYCWNRPSWALRLRTSEVPAGLSEGWLICLPVAASSCSWVSWDRPDWRSATIRIVALCWVTRETSDMAATR